MNRYYTKEEKEFLRQYIPGHHYSEIVEKFNSTFDYKITTKQVNEFCKNNHIKTGYSGKFQKGHVPTNKGKKGINYEGMKKTQFKKGCVPYNQKPIGSERIENQNGYTLIKTKKRGPWRLKQRVVYEQHHGEIPPGGIIMFLDGDKSNFDIDNLVCVDRKILGKLRTMNLFSEDADITKAGITLGKLAITIDEKKKKNNNNNEDSLNA